MVSPLSFTSLSTFQVSVSLSKVPADVPFTSSIVADVRRCVAALWHRQKTFFKTVFRLKLTQMFQAHRRSAAGNHQLTMMFAAAAAAAASAAGTHSHSLPQLSYGHPVCKKREKPSKRRKNPKNPLPPATAACALLLPPPLPPTLQLP